MINHTGCTEYCNNFTVSLKMINVIDKKQVYDSVIKGKENASKEWNCIILMFLTSFNVYFVFDHVCFMYICLKTAIWLFLEQSLTFSDEDRLSTLRLTIPVTQFCTEFDVIHFFIALKYCLSTVVWVLQNSGIWYRQWKIRTSVAAQRSLTDRVLPKTQSNLASRSSNLAQLTI